MGGGAAGVFLGFKCKGLDIYTESRTVNIL